MLPTVNDGHFGFEGACQCTFTEGGFFVNGDAFSICRTVRLLTLESIIIPQGGVLNTDIDNRCDDADNSAAELGAGCTDPAEHGFVEGQLMTFRVERRGELFTFWASEILVHRYRTDAAVTSIGWRPHRATFFVYDWQVVRHV